MAPSNPWTYQAAWNSQGWLPGQYLLLSFSSYSFSTLHCSLMAVASAPVKMNNLYIFWPPSSTITSMKMIKYTKRNEACFWQICHYQGFITFSRVIVIQTKALPSIKIINKGQKHFQAHLQRRYILLSSSLVLFHFFFLEKMGRILHPTISY